MTVMEEYHRRLIASIVDGEVASRDDLQRLKVRLCRELRLNGVPPNSATLAVASEGQLPLVLPLLRRKPVRTLSGVAVVAVMTSPHDCPHGRCIYCPGGVSNGSPQSYTGKEPAARRAVRNDFDPVRQVESRIRQLEAIGHGADKIDLIVMGGTFTSREPEYQEWFVKGCFDAMNGITSSTLEEAHRFNETAAHRCIGLTVETRPDVFDGSQIHRSLALGTTRVELGVQILDDTILAGVQRGHGVEEVTRATADARRMGLKICYHVMPGLPGASPERDLESFRLMFDDPRFRPDMVKIYPTLVVAGTGLYDMWLKGEYRPYDTEEATRLIADMKEMVPEWARIQRIQRDIPLPEIEAGVDKSHIRMLARDLMAADGRRCRCIRCREVGHVGAGAVDPVLRTVTYEAADGVEHFVSLVYEDNDALLGYVRLRLDGEAAVRELKVFGRMAPIGHEGDVQHRGHGRRLLDEAEHLTEDAGYDRLRVTSGVGVRRYYAARGYVRSGPYMVKSMSKRLLH